MLSKTSDLAEKLTKLAKLYTDGLLTDEDFKSLKARLISQFERNDDKENTKGSGSKNNPHDQSPSSVIAMKRFLSAIKTACLGHSNDAVIDMAMNDDMDMKSQRQLNMTVISSLKLFGVMAASIVALWLLSPWIIYWTMDRDTYITSGADSSVVVVWIDEDAAISGDRLTAAGVNRWNPNSIMPFVACIVHNGARVSVMAAPDIHWSYGYLEVIVTSREQTSSGYVIEPNSCRGAVSLGDIKWWGNP